MSILKNISRRSFLVSAGAFLALPKLETFASNKAVSNKKKMIFLGQGYGFTESSYYPTKSGKFSKIGLTDGLSPLKKHQDDFSLLSNIINVGTTNPHCGSLTFLTGAAYTSPKNIKNSISCDQLAAEHLSKDTRYKSLILSTNETKSGHGNTRSNLLSMSWDKAGKPLSGLNTSLDLYKKLFASNEDKSALLRRINKRQSILDSMRVNAGSVSKKIAKSDKEKLDEYYQSLRQVELGLKKQIDWVNIAKPEAPFKHPEKIDGVAEVKLMFDMIALAIQTDQTRVISYIDAFTVRIDQYGYYHASTQPFALQSFRRENSKISRKRQKVYGASWIPH